MTVSSKKEALILFAGDIFFFLLSLWLTLLIRYREFPSGTVLYDHIVPFGFLFILWFFVFFIAGLYERHTLLLKNKIPTLILNSQLINSAIAVIFFYLIPFFGITPKTNLVIYIVISFFLMLLWRIYGVSILTIKDRQKAILIGTGEEMEELKEEVNNNSHHGITFVSSMDINDIDSLDFQEEILKRIYSENVQVVAVDLRNEKVEPILPNLYNLIFSKIRFMDMYKIYEDIFNRVPLSLVKYNWFIENISSSPRRIYDMLKRLMDILISVPLTIVSLIFYPFVYIAIKAEDRGPIFIVQERIGKNNTPIHILKFRTMSSNDQGHQDRVGENRDTKVGQFLRKTRIDELPQLWNVIKGDISLIGPRPELPTLVKLYEKQIPYYNVRHIIKPGLSGWAQLYQKDPPKVNASYDKTTAKLSYDLYYIKNRSIMLDVKIALKTIKTLLSRSGL